MSTNAKKKGEPIDTEYRVISCGTQITQYQKPYLKYTLENAEGQVNAFAWGETEVPNIIGLEPIRVIGRIRRLDQTPVIDIIETESRWLEGPESGTRLLPRSRCFTPEALDRLIQVYESIQSSHLKQFCDDAFSELDLGIPFLQLPASGSHHHAEPGGLLLHSVEVAELVSTNHMLSDHDRDIGIVAAIFHDVGKIRTLSGKSKTGLYIDHELLTLELLAVPLKYLEQKHSREADELRYCWTSRIPPMNQKLVTAAARALKAADQSSARNGITP